MSYHTVVIFYPFFICLLYCLSDNVNKKSMLISDDDEEDDVGVYHKVLCHIIL